MPTPLEAVPAPSAPPAKRARFDPTDLVGKMVKKSFHGTDYIGKVIEFNPPWYLIEFEDGDRDEVTRESARKSIKRYLEEEG